MGDISSWMWMAIGLAFLICFAATIFGFYLNDPAFVRLGVMMAASLALLVVVWLLPLPPLIENALSLGVFIVWFLGISIFGNEPEKIKMA